MPCVRRPGASVSDDVVDVRGVPRPGAVTALGGGIVLALVLGVAGCAGGGGAPADAPTRLARTFDLQAHRGGADLTSENTLEAFSRALDIGVTTLELDEVVDLLRERGADDVGLNVEVKVQADDLGLTVPRAEYAAKVWAVLDEGGVAGRATIQSFDWASLTAVHRIAPRARLVALVSPERLERGKEGASPWLGGIDIDDVGGDVVGAASRL